MYEDFVLVRNTGNIRKTNIKTMPYPGFPTDMQPQMAALLAQADGTSVITEGIYDNRFKYAQEMRKMGADIHVDGKVCVIQGRKRLTGAPVLACDLRAGAAMVIAALCAEGESVIDDVHFIERGYEDFVSKLQHLGADIHIEYFPEEPEGSEIITAIS